MSPITPLNSLSLQLCWLSSQSSGVNGAQSEATVIGRTIGATLAKARKNFSNSSNSSNF